MTNDEAGKLRRLHNAAVSAQVELHDAYGDETAGEDEREEALADSLAAEAAFNAELDKLVDPPVAAPTDKRMPEEIF